MSKMFGKKAGKVEKAEATGEEDFATALYIRKGANFILLTKEYINVALKALEPMLDNTEIMPGVVPTKDMPAEEQIKRRGGTNLVNTPPSHVDETLSHLSLDLTKHTLVRASYYPAEYEGIRDLTPVSSTIEQVLTGVDKFVYVNMGSDDYYKEIEKALTKHSCFKGIGSINPYRLVFGPAESEVNFPPKLTEDVILSFQPRVAPRVAEKKLAIKGASSGVEQTEDDDLALLIRAYRTQGDCDPNKSQISAPSIKKFAQKLSNACAGILGSDADFSKNPVTQAFEMYETVTILTKLGENPGFSSEFTNTQGRGTDSKHLLIHFKLLTGGFEIISVSGKDHYSKRVIGN